MNSLVDLVRTKLVENALPLSVFAATALIAVVMGPVATNNMTLHEVLHNLRHALGLPCH